MEFHEIPQQEAEDALIEIVDRLPASRLLCVEGVLHRAMLHYQADVAALVERRRLAAEMARNRQAEAERPKEWHLKGLEGVDCGSIDARDPHDALDRYVAMGKSGCLDWEQYSQIYGLEASVEGNTIQIERLANASEENPSGG